VPELIEAIKELTEQLKLFRQENTLELADGTTVSSMEYLADNIRFLGEVVECHAVSAAPEMQDHPSQESALND
jgi:hypothetical protein